MSRYDAFEITMYVIFVVCLLVMGGLFLDPLQPCVSQSEAK